MTTSAVAKLIPRPPALVLNMKINFELLGSLYALIEIYKQKKNMNESSLIIYTGKGISSDYTNPLFLVKASHLSLLMWGLTVQATVAVVPPHAVVLQDVQHPGHLAEDEDAGT